MMYLPVVCTKESHREQKIEHPRGIIHIPGLSISSTAWVRGHSLTFLAKARPEFPLVLLVLLVLS